MSKGSWKRKPDVPNETVRDNWDRIFTKREKKTSETKRSLNGYAKRRHTV